MMASSLQSLGCPLRIYISHQNVIGVVRGKGEDRNLCLRKRSNKRMQNTDCRKRKRPFELEACPLNFLSMLVWKIFDQTYDR